MKAEDKAKELVEKFYQSSPELFGTGKAMQYAKQCALIAVDEIIAQLPPCVSTSESNINYQVHQYWLKVKTHIQIL